MKFSIIHNLIQLTAVAVIAAGSSQGPGLSSSSRRPSFLGHVTQEDLQKAMAKAKDLHQQAVKNALLAFNTDSIPALDIIDQSTSHAAAIKTTEIKAPGSIPDFPATLPRQVHVTQLMTEDECRKVIRLAEDHFKGSEWTTQQSGQYNVTGFYIKEVPSVHEWFVRIVKERLFPLLCRQYPDFVASPDDLCVDNAYLFKYNPTTGRRTDVHTDSGCLSFTIALNDNYEGGGTYFEGLVQESGSKILEMKAGEVTLRPGGVKHCGYPVKEGDRYIIGGFCMARSKPEYVRQLLQSAEDIPALEAAVCFNPSCDAPYNLLANAYSKNRMSDKAKEVLLYCLENVHPSSGEVAYALGSIYMDEGAYDEAKKCFQTCLDADDCDVDAMMGYAQACAKLGDQASEEKFNRKIIDSPDASGHTRAIAYCNLGVLYEGKDEEIEYYQKSIAYNAGRFVPIFSLACAYADRKQWNKAATLFRQAIPLADSSDHETRALQKLYVTASHLVRERSPPPSSQEQVISLYQEIMGYENFQKLRDSS